MISLKVHNVIDYILGVFLGLSPWIFGFSDLAIARDLFMYGAAILIVYSLFTNYYYSLAQAIPLGMHMIFDALLGAVLILAPALFGYRDSITNTQYALHLILGVATIGVVALTSPRTESGKSPAERAEIGHESPIPH